MSAPRFVADVPHDIMAFDVQDVGVVHLASSDPEENRYCVFTEPSRTCPTSHVPRGERGSGGLLIIDSLPPSAIHPGAAVSLADTIDDKLRSVFYLIDPLRSSWMRIPLESSLFLAPPLPRPPASAASILGDLY
ncbi:hypothetical protein MAPG_09570 [Magnaporthiopsis poae ATCC 64411]|uniref:Uncharacterized protein n=1 Tax=Magnaporthiopsis poae (strain ATCC 64411 / 73-15) TaxID=644358 RepID=A0A0C4EAA8_MAGP6|nr:hypothetical protein MAPG_09570 [Magnaporthiopsis poae ATCC 64411]